MSSCEVTLKRGSFQADENEILKKAFDESKFKTSEGYKELAKQLCRTPRSVIDWFKPGT
jgi:hypothetical protein